MRGVVLLLAAGSGERLGTDEPKALVLLEGIPIVRRAAESACAADLVDSLVVAAHPGSEARTAEVLEGLSRPVVVVAGGPTRQASAAAALAAAGDAEAVLVHDAARALAPSGLFDLCLRELDAAEAVCVARPVSDTVKEVDGTTVRATLDRGRLVAAETPQAFHAAVYRRAHAAAADAGVLATDDAALVERIGVPVRVVMGEAAGTNIKITTPADLEIARSLLRSRRVP